MDSKYNLVSALNVSETESAEYESWEYEKGMGLVEAIKSYCETKGRPFNKDQAQTAAEIIENCGRKYFWFDTVEDYEGED